MPGFGSPSSSSFSGFSGFSGLSDFSPFLSSDPSMPGGGAPFDAALSPSSLFGASGFFPSFFNTTQYRLAEGSRKADAERSRPKRRGPLSTDARKKSSLPSRENAGKSAVENASVIGVTLPVARSKSAMRS